MLIFDFYFLKSFHIWHENKFYLFNISFGLFLPIYGTPLSTEILTASSCCTNKSEQTNKQTNKQTYNGLYKDIHDGIHWRKKSSQGWHSIQ